MTYDPFRSRQPVFEEQEQSAFTPGSMPSQPDVGLSPGPISFGNRMAPEFGGPSSLQDMLPSMQTPAPSRVPAGDYPGVGKFNVGIGLPTPWVAPQMGQQTVPTPPAPQLGGQAMGLFEGTLRGLEMLPGQFLPGVINDHINNLFGLVGSVPDTVLRQFGTIKELPGGGDIEENFSLMPDNDVKRRYEAAAAADPVNRLHFMAQYLRDYEKDWASASGRNRLLSFADLPSESLGEQLQRVVMGILGTSNMAARRTYVGSDARDVKGTVLNAAPESLPEDLRWMREQYLTGAIDYDQLLDDIASSRWAWSHDNGLVGTIASFGADVITDPLTWASFGTAKLAASAVTGAGMKQGVKAASLLRERSMADFNALVSRVGNDPIDLARAMQTSHPDIIDAATASLTRRERNTIVLQPVYDTANRVVNRAMDPLHWFGIDRVGKTMQARFARSSVHGVANALGAGNIRALVSLESAAGGGNRVAEALGVYGSNIANAVLQRNLANEVRRSSDPEAYAGQAMDYINARRRVPTEQSEMEDMARAVAREFVPRQRVGEDALVNTLNEARAFATKAVEDITGASTSAAAKFVGKADRKVLSTVHALNYGRVVNEFVPAKQEAVAYAERIKRSVDPADAAAVKDADERLSYMNRLTVVGDRELTVDRAQETLARVKAGDIGAARAAIERYDILGHNFRGSEMADDILLPQLRLLLEQLLDPTSGKARLTQTVDPATLQPALRALFERERLRYGDQGYEVGLAPEDTWGVVYDEEGKAIAVHPWTDVTNEMGKAWTPSRMDRVRMGLFTPIRGNRLLYEARRRFVRLGIKQGLTEGESDALFHALRREANRRNVGSRGLTTETIWQVAGEVDIPMSTRVKIGQRGLALLLVKAWEGDLTTVGVSSKLSGVLKTKMATRGNFAARMAEDFYPRARFYLSPNFLLQETLEGPFFNIIRGNKAGIKWNEQDIATLRVLDSIRTSEAFTDQYEYLFFNQALKGEARRVGGPGTRLERITSKLNTGGVNGGINSVKQLNYVRQWGKEASREFEKAVESVQPGMYNTMMLHYGTTDRQEIMLRYFTERGLGRGDDPRLGAHIMDMTKPPTHGKGMYILLGDVARDHGFPDTASLREAVRLSRYSEAQFTETMDRLGAHPDYIKAAYAVASRPSLPEFRSAMIASMQLAGASKTQAKAAVNQWMGMHRRVAQLLDVPLEEFLANRYTGAPSYLSHSGGLPAGALTQHAKGIVEAQGHQWTTEGERYDRVVERARKLHAVPSPERLDDVLAATDMVGGDALNAPEEIRPRAWEYRPEEIAPGFKLHHAPGMSADPHDILDAWHITLGRKAILSIGEWYKEMPALMMGFVDMLDTDTVDLFNVQAQKRMQELGIAPVMPKSTAPMRVTRDRTLAPTNGYVYHGTGFNGIKGIAKTGLPAGSFFADSPTTTRGYGDVILRMRRDAVSDWRAGMGDGHWETRGAIDPGLVEYLGEDNRFHPMTDLEPQVPEGMGIDPSMDPRDEMAARLLSLWGATQMNTSPQNGFDYMMRTLDTLTRGERSGWVRQKRDKKGKPVFDENGEPVMVSSYGRALAHEQTERMLMELNRLSDKGLGQKLYDFIDSLMGNSRRTVDGGQTMLQPAAIDMHVAHSLGFLDQKFINGIIDRAVYNSIGGEAYFNSLDNQNARDPEAIKRRAENNKMEYQVARAKVLRAYDLTEDDFAALPKSFVFAGTKKGRAQYEWGVVRLNELALYANTNDWGGRSNWTAADMQAVAWEHAQQLLGRESGTPGNIFERAMWSVGFASQPATMSLHDAVTGGQLFHGLRKDLDDVMSQPGAVRMGKRERHFIHYDSVRTLIPTLRQETGFVTTGHAFASGRELRGAVMPMTALAGLGTDAMVNDAMDMAGYTLQRDDIIATSTAFPGYEENPLGRPYMADPSKGYHWAMDFVPTRKATPEELDALARYIAHKRGVPLDTLHVARDDEGRWVIRGLWMRNVTEGAVLEDFIQSVPLTRVVERQLGSGTWAAEGGTGIPSDLGVTAERRMVRVKRSRNWDETTQSAQKSVNSQHRALIAEYEAEIANLNQRIMAFETGDIPDPARGIYQTETTRQLNAVGPGPSGRQYSGHYDSPFDEARNRNLEPNYPNEVHIEHGLKNYGGSPDPDEGLVLVANDAGDEWMMGMTVAFKPGTDAIDHIHFTSTASGVGKGVGTKSYDIIADTTPELKFSNGIGAGGSFSEVGGIFAHDWMVHRRDTLTRRVEEFNAWAVQEEQAQAIAQATGRDINDVRAEQLGKPYLDRIRGRGRPDLAERLVNQHAPAAVRTVEDAVRRHAPGTYAAVAGTRTRIAERGRWDPDPGEPAVIVSTAAGGAYAGSPGVGNAPVASSGPVRNTDGFAAGAVRASTIWTADRRDANYVTVDNSYGMPHEGLTSQQYTAMLRQGHHVTNEMSQMFDPAAVTDDIIVRYPAAYDLTGDYTSQMEVRLSDMEVWVDPSIGWVPLVDPGMVAAANAQNASLPSLPPVNPNTPLGQVMGALSLNTAGNYVDPNIGRASAFPDDVPEGEPEWTTSEPTFIQRGGDGVMLNPYRDTGWSYGRPEQVDTYAHAGITGAIYAEMQEQGYLNPRAGWAAPRRADHNDVLDGQIAVRWPITEHTMALANGQGVTFDNVEVWMGDFIGWRKMGQAPLNLGSNPFVNNPFLASLPAGTSGPLAPPDLEYVTTSHGHGEGLWNAYQYTPTDSNNVPRYLQGENSADYSVAAMPKAIYQQLVRTGEYDWGNNRWFMPYAPHVVVRDTDSPAVYLRVPRTTYDSGITTAAMDIEVWMGDQHGWVPMLAPTFLEEEPDFRFQRKGGAPTGAVRAALAWDKRREATLYFLDDPDVTTAVHEAFHLFAENLSDSSRLRIREQYELETGTPDPGWTVEVEEWASAKFEEYAASGVAPHPSMQANFNAFAKYATTVLKLPTGSLAAPLRETFDSIFQRDPSAATSMSTFDPDEERVWEASRIALLRSEEQSQRTHYYSRGRSWVERSLNHPYLGMYPLSYMWGKVVPEMVRFLVKKPFGLNAPFGGLLMAKNVYMQTQLQLQTDPELRKWVEEHPELIRYLQLLVPGTPFEAPVNLPVVARRQIQNYLANEQRRGKGEDPTGLDLGKTIDDMLSYAVGIGHFGGQMSDIAGELMPQAPEEEAKPEADKTPNPYAALLQ